MEINTVRPEVFSVTSYFTEPGLTQLRSEAQIQLGTLEQRCRPTEESNPSIRTVTQRAWHYVARPGPLLADMHRQPALRQLVSDTIKRNVLPTRASYIEYPTGGFIDVHRDFEVCRYTALASLSGTIEPLYIHPALTGLHRAELGLLSAITFEPGRPADICGTPVSIEEHSLLIFSGSSLPHHRNPTSRPTILLAMCFDSLL